MKTTLIPNLLFDLSNSSSSSSDFLLIVLFGMLILGVLGTLLAHQTLKKHSNL